jgi:hypothetical protein
MKSTPCLPSEILKEAKQKIGHSCHWTQGYYSKNEYGSNLPDSPYSICWCSSGALLGVCGFSNFEGAPKINPIWQAKQYLDYCVSQRGLMTMRGTKEIKVESVEIWNDLSTTTHPDVMQLFQEAIDMALSHENVINKSLE